MREDPDPRVSCLATQTFYVVEAKEKLRVGTQASCSCLRRPWQRDSGPGRSRLLSLDRELCPQNL